MQRHFFHYMACAMLVLALALPAKAALKTGDNAPDFTAPAALNGQEFTFRLSEALAQGPVVLYFYPAAFTPGCTAEAHAFADATDQYNALGAKVVGVSRDDIEKLKKFSVSACKGKFAVVADTDGKITAAYDSAMALLGMADRITYVITPDHKIYFAFSDLGASQHVPKSLQALQTWRAAGAQ